MLAFIVKRVLGMIPAMFAISILAFTVIQLPPGDYVTSYIAQMSSSGSLITQQEAANLRTQYGLEQPMYMQYVR